MPATSPLLGTPVAVSRRAPRARAPILSGALLLAAAALWTRRGAVGDDGSAPTARANLADADAPTSRRVHARIEVPQRAFLEFPSVAAWLKKHAANVTDPMRASAHDLTAYLPVRFTIDLDKRALAGSIGEAAAEGYVGFNMYFAERASWMVVMDYAGRLHQVAPAKSFDGQGAQHFCAFKLYDEDTFLLAQESNYSGSGRQYKWNWRTDEYTLIGGDHIRSAHDIQWSATHSDCYWVPEGNWACSKNVLLVNASDGETVRTLETIGGSDCDVNHAQLINDDTDVIVSLRLCDGIAKYAVDPAGNRTQRPAATWIVGGPYGQFPIVDFDGFVWPPNTTVWSWQHNAEYIGEDEYIMLDNGGLGNNARLLVVAINETAQEARLRWQYKLDTYMEIYGDSDPVVSGNVLGAYWREGYGDASENDQAVSGLVEVARPGQDEAWHLRVYDRACPNDWCGNDIYSGWHFYSAERFYERPLFPSAGYRGAPTCTGGADGALSFTVYNSFKQSHTAPGEYKLIEDGGGRLVASGDLEFAAYWRPTWVESSALSFGKHATFPVAVTLVVQNDRGRAAKFSLNCTR